MRGTDNTHTLAFTLIYTRKQRKKGEQRGYEKESENMKIGPSPRSV